jgi:hypothetical protein
MTDRAPRRRQRGVRRHQHMLDWLQQLLGNVLVWFLWWRSIVSAVP